MNDDKTKYLNEKGRREKRLAMAKKNMNRDDDLTKEENVEYAEEENANREFWFYYEGLAEFLMEKFQSELCTPEELKRKRDSLHNLINLFDIAIKYRGSKRNGAENDSKHD
jgi:hypothetical protein